MDVKNEKGKIAFVVLGMHRSGTSAVAGSLAKLGAHPPAQLMPAKEDNPLGFWESERIVAFSDEILTAAGSNWYDWGPLNFNVFTGRFSDHFVSASKWILDVEFGDAETIVLKDPRICRFYPFWRSSLKRSGFDTVAILPVRDPNQVAHSLKRRNGISHNLGMRLWLRHVLDAEFASRGDPREVATLDDLIAQRAARFSAIMDLANRPVGNDRSCLDNISEFWDRETPSVVHRDQRAVPDLVQRTWQAFQTLSAQGDNAESFATLDQLKLEFESLCSLFYDPPAIQ